jgi:hypothetical protein
MLRWGSNEGNWNWQYGNRLATGIDIRGRRDNPGLLTGCRVHKKENQETEAEVGQ